MLTGAKGGLEEAGAQDLDHCPLSLSRGSFPMKAWRRVAAHDSAYLPSRGARGKSLRGCHSVRQSPRRDAGSVGDSCLLLSCCGYLAAGVLLNITSSPAIAKLKYLDAVMVPEPFPPRVDRSGNAGNRSRVDKSLFKFLRTSLRAFRRRMVDTKGGSTALNRATRRKMTKTKGDWDRHRFIRLTI